MTPPVITCPDSVPSTSVDSGKADAAVNWSPTPSATDDTDGDVTSSITCDDSSGKAVMSSDSFAVGTTTVTCSVSDSAMNVGSCEFTITVVGRC